VALAKLRAASMIDDDRQESGAVGKEGVTRPSSESVKKAGDQLAFPGVSQIALTPFSNTAN